MRHFPPPPNRVIPKLYDLGLGPFIGRFVLLLTTTGRKSGLPRTTPLQYEKIDGAYYVGSVRGVQADWFRNLVANPRVEVRVKAQRWCGWAEAVTAPDRIMGEGEKGNRELNACALARVIRASKDDQETKRLQDEFFAKGRQH